MTNPDSQRASHVPALNGWRGLAVTLVLLGHFGADSRVWWCSTLGVDLFFALSGRLMADILFVRRMPLRAFFARRFARVYPTLVVFVLIAMVLTSGTSIGFSPQAALLALTFSLNYAIASGYPFNTLDHIWSLCVEEHSYMLLAVLALACRGFSSKAAGYLTLAFGAAAIANGVIQLDIFHRNPFAVLWRSDTSMAGIFVAVGLRLVLGGGDKAADGWRWLAPLALLAALLARALGTDALVYFGMTGVFLGLAAARIEDAWPPLRAVFETRPLQFLGRCSFSLYLWQELFYRLAHQDVMPSFVFLALAVATGLFGYYLLEQPLRAACAALLSRQAVAQPAIG